MRIAKRLEETEAAAVGGGATERDPALLRQRRHGQLPPLQRRGSDSAIPREKEGLLTPAVPTPPQGPKSTKRSPKEGVGGAADDKEADKKKKAKAKAKKKQRKDPLEGRKLNVLSYVVFLCVFVAASSNGRTPDMYYQNSVVETYMSLGQVSQQPASQQPPPQPSMQQRHCPPTARQRSPLTRAFTAGGYRRRIPGTRCAHPSPSRSSGQTFGRG